MLTDKLLHGMAMQAANMVKTELRYKKQFGGLLAVYSEGKGLHRMRTVEHLIIEKCGEDWMSNGRAKDVVCRILHEAVGLIAVDAIVIASIIDRFESNEAFGQLSRDEQKQIIDGAHPRNLPQYFTSEEAVASVAQTPERVCILHQKLVGSLFIGEPEVKFFPQCDFSGRMKMFGNEVPNVPA
jgi:hypothetical protein